MVTFSIPAGGKWSGVIGRGKLVQITARGSRANLSTLLYHAPYPSERYNMPDTLKAQHTAYLTAGNVLMSDQGKVLASITEDSVGWHDPLAGYTTRQQTDEKYGSTCYQSNRNEWYHSGAENLTVELFRNHLTPRDLTPTINFFSKVICELDGSMRYVKQETDGKSITLRTEMDVLMLFSNTPNPLDPEKVYPSTTMEVQISDTAPLQEDDRCIQHCDENKRAYENTWNAYSMLKGANV